MESSLKAILRSTGAFVPARRMSNDELATIVETSDEWIFSHTGIRNRHIAAEGQAASDLAYTASVRALEQAGMQADELDLVLVATSTPDHLSFPSTASILQERLGARRAGAMDLTAACTGFVYALETARAFVEAGSARNVLVSGTELFSRILDWKDRNTCVLFGDGAGSVIVSSTEENADRGLIGSYLRSEGSGAGSLERPAGGTRIPFVPGETPQQQLCMRMDGRQVYVFAVRAFGETIDSLLSRYGFGVGDLTWIVPHQANVRIVDAAAKRAGLPREKIFMNIQEYANTSAASIPIALDEMNRKGMLRPGDLVMTVGFGAGLTYGGNLFRW